MINLIVMQAEHISNFIIENALNERYIYTKSTILLIL